MECVSIMGIGVLSALGDNIDTIWEKLMREDELVKEQAPFSFDSGISLFKKKKANRYSEMGIFVTRAAITNSELDLESLDKERVGTVFTTGYGPINSVLKFSESVAEGDWEYCSPVVFANTVNNACIGHICMTFGLKGASTMLMASNNLLYTQLLLNTGKADYIVTGAIEEYCEDLLRALETKTEANPVFFSEGAVSFMLKNGAADNSYCKIIDIMETSLDKYPLTDFIDAEKTSNKIKEMINRLANDYQIDVFFSSSNGTYFDEVESKAAHDILDKDVVYVNRVKELFGETLGASLNMSVMVAAVCLKKGILPSRLDSKQRKVKCAVVSGYDIAGNYALVLLQNS